MQPKEHGANRMTRAVTTSAAIARERSEPETAAPISAVSRAMEVLERLAIAPEGISVSELSRSLRIDKSVVSRILSSLAMQGYVQKDASSDQYQLTFKISALAYAHFGAVGFPERCLPILRELAQQTGELVELAVADGEQLWLVAKVEGWQRVRVAAYSGGPVVLHAMASGKAWLATLPKAEALRIATARDLEPITPTTITTPEALAAELEQVRRQGYAVSREELMEGATSVAVAVPSPVTRGTAVGSLVVVAPSFRMTDTVVAEIVPELQARARALSSVWPIAASSKGREE